ncbi:MAG: DEAD/DEAH box helicase [Alphaproteobacteria bacterium]
MTQFKDLGLAEPLLKALDAEGYTTPTPIQAKAIPALMEGGDLLGMAQTGTGKTAAFVLPLLQQIATARRKPQPKRCGALILAPTRELAAQIADSIATYGQNVRHSATVVVGGVKPGPQIRKLAQGVDILVATPGRLLDHMGTGAIRLDETTTIVLDEADQMLDMGFIPAIRKVMEKLPRDRQTLLFSATMPKEIKGLANDFLTDPVEVSIGPASRPIDKIDQRVIRVDRADKGRSLIDLLKTADLERAIVFTRTKHGADKVKRQLEKAGLPAGAIHGNKSQNQRTKALDAFKKGTAPVLVATDIAARGIDVSGVSHVVNFDLPDVSEAYVHRIGRTARAGKSGEAISLVDSGERGLLRDIEKLIGRELPIEGEWSHISEEERPKRGGGRPRQGKPQGAKSHSAKPAGGRPKRRRNRRRGGQGASASASA